MRDEDIIFILDDIAITIENSAEPHPTRSLMLSD